jgi:hypothetical protein
MKYRWLFIILFISCRINNAPLNASEMELVKDSVKAMTDHISKDLSVRGPVAWLDYFEDGPNFYMASDGLLVFRDYQSAGKFINDTLVKTFVLIILRWDQLRIDPLSINLASVSSGFHEELKDSAGKSIFTNGYFSAVAEKTSHGWQLRNTHWSILKQ